MRIGLGVSEDLTLARQQQVARDVASAGLASLWTNEARGRDALALCQAWAAATTSLEVGVAVVPIWTRSPAQLAMGAATLQEASGGRFHLGLGVSHPGTMGPWHGADVRRPLTAAGEYLRILDQLFSGDRTDVDGEVFSSHHFRLGISPLPPAPHVHLGAMGPRMLELAGQDASGAFLNWAGPDEVRRAGEVVRSAGEAPTVTTYVRVAVDPDRDVARAALAREFGGYAALPAYAAHFERQGLGDAVVALKAAHKAGEPAGSAVTDEQLSTVGWWGSPDDDPSKAFTSFAEAGLDHLVARVVVTGDDPEVSIRHALTAVARAA